MKPKMPTVAQLRAALPPLARAGAVQARGWGRRKAAGVMNRLEQGWELVLAERQATGRIVWFKYEAVTFKLAPDLRYTPDFLVMLPDGTLECHECKGFFAEHNKVKVKAAAAMFPFRFVLVQRAAKKSGGTWSEVTIGAEAEPIELPVSCRECAALPGQPHSKSCPRAGETTRSPQ